MKQKMSFIGILISVPFLMIGNSRQDKFTGLEGAYLGQNPPMMTAEVFAPDIISTELFSRHYGCQNILSFVNI
jgi:hypothetical protein